MGGFSEAGNLRELGSCISGELLRLRMTQKGFFNRDPGEDEVLVG